MKINKLELKNFRNHSKTLLEFGSKSSLIFGQNGSGKTNILEAIHLISTTKSLRAEFDREMISHNENFARLDLIGDVDDEKITMEMVLTKSPNHENLTSKKVKINKVAKTVSNFAGTLNTVLFTPHDVEIFTSSPSIRRKHLDALFFQIDKTYKKATSEYTKALRQRNKLLEMIRDFGTGMELIDFWTEKAINSGQIIYAKRKQFLDFCNENIQKHGKSLENENFNYYVDYDKSEISEERINKYKQAEIASGRTLVGPHRDDFIIKLNNYDVAKYGSRGQKRGTILALKLCEMDFIEKSVGKRPVLLLDDIFSELDQKHQEAILNITPLQQTIITSADIESKKFNLKLIEL